MRYVPPARLLKDEDGKVLGLLPQAFARRPDEHALSVSWLEYFKKDKASNLSACVDAQRETLQVAKNCVYAVAMVDKVKQVCVKKQKPVKIVYEPSRKNASHSALHVQLDDDLTVLADLALEFEKDMHPNSKF